MWCLVKLPNSVMLEIQLDHQKAIGQECLEKVCENLGISNESDYFGLKYQNSKNEELWLNLRNPIGHVHPLRLALRVKFWVPPHLLLQESTRHQFYLHARMELVEKKLLTNDWAIAAKLIGLIAQAETGDYDPTRTPHAVYAQFASISAQDQEGKPQDFLHKVLQEHRDARGMKPASAEYWLLKHLSNLDNFGEELFHKNPSLGVGPHGICVYQSGGEKQTIPYTAIQSASSHKRVFRLEYLSVEEQQTVKEVKLDSREAASGLYRAITEKHAFYSCETVRSAVTKQFIRDLKGTIVSIFNEDSTLGKKYVFDIRRTCREVYDNARRALYQGAVSEGVTDCIDVEGMQNIGGCNSYDENECKESHEKLARIMDAMTCKICMDHTLNTAFLPCAHVLACSECAARCDRCPLCRADITQAQRIYLPTEFCETNQAN